MKADRLMSVLLLLQARGQITERELAEQLEVSQRTIHRDLESLSAARIPVSAMRGAQGGWQLEKGWRTHVPGLDEAELHALLMAQPRGLGNPRLAAAAQSALNKLMAAMPEPMKAQAAHLQQRLHVDPTGWRDTGEDLSMLSAVQDAVARDRKLTFDYTRADGEQSSRTVDALGLVSKGLHWYLVARTANGMRTFRVSRMKRVAVLAVGFERPARFDLAEHWRASTSELDRKRASYRTVLSLTSEAPPGEFKGGVLPKLLQQGLPLVKPTLERLCCTSISTTNGRRNLFARTGFDGFSSGAGELAAMG